MFAAAAVIIIMVVVHAVDVAVVVMTA